MHDFIHDIVRQDLPIKWESLKPRPLLTLLIHSDCDGEINPSDCSDIANDIDFLIELLPDEIKLTARKFVVGLRAAAADGLPLKFRQKHKQI
jgi:hypothetical protein